MPADKKTILKQVLREECLPALARQAGYFSVAERLRDNGYDIHLKPRGAAARQFAIREGTVVIRPKPTTQPHDGHLVTVEGLLLELFMESFDLQRWTRLGTLNRGSRGDSALTRSPIRMSRVTSAATKEKFMERGPHKLALAPESHPAAGH